MENENQNFVRKEPVFSMKLRAGRKRTYFFDVRPTRSNDFYLTITESKKKFNEEKYERHKIFIYKEDFNKFIDTLNQAVDHIKTELMPDYDFDEFHNNREEKFSADGHNSNHEITTEVKKEVKSEIESKASKPLDSKEEKDNQEEVKKTESVASNASLDDDDLKW